MQGTFVISAAPLVHIHIETEIQTYIMLMFISLLYDGRSGLMLPRKYSSRWVLDLEYYWHLLAITSFTITCTGKLFIGTFKCLVNKYY